MPESPADKALFDQSKTRMPLNGITVLDLTLARAGPKVVLVRPSKSRSARVFLTEIRALSTSTGLPQRLRDHGIPESILPVLASEAVKIERLLRNNPREVTLADALRLYQQAW